MELRFVIALPCHRVDTQKYILSSLRPYFYWRMIWKPWPKMMVERMTELPKVLTSKEAVFKFACSKEHLFLFGPNCSLSSLIPFFRSSVNLKYLFSDLHIKKINPQFLKHNFSINQKSQKLLFEIPFLSIFFCPFSLTMVSIMICH